MSQNKPKNSISSSVHEIWCCFHEYGAALLTPTTSSGSTPASPLSSPLLGEPWLGQCRWKGPPLRATALTACEGPAWVSQAQPYQPRSSSPSLQKLWCRQYVHTYTCTHGQCIPSRALRSPSQPLSQTSAAGEVKTPSRIKEEKQQEEGGRDRGMGEKKTEKVYLHVRWRCLPRRQFPTRLSLGRWGEEIVELRTASREKAELRGSFQGKSENDVAASLVVEFYFSPMECLCALVSLIQTGSVNFFFLQNQEDGGSLTCEVVFEILCAQCLSRYKYLAD